MVTAPDPSKRVQTRRRGLPQRPGDGPRARQTSRSGELDAVEDERRRAHRGVPIRVVADRDEAVPELEVVAGDVHLAHRLGEPPAAHAEAAHAEREVARRPVRVPAEEAGDEDPLPEVAEEVLPGAAAELPGEVRRASGCRASARTSNLTWK